MLVTTAKRTAERLEGAAAFKSDWLAVVLEDVDDGFLVESAEEIVYMNRAYGELLGYDRPEAVVRRHLSVIVADEDAPRLLDFGRRREASHDAPKRYHFAARHFNGSSVRLNAAVSTSMVDRRVLIATVVEPCHLLPETLDTPVIGKLHQPLTTREIEVMDMILAGSRMKEIAFTLKVSPKTVATHRTRLLQKLGLSDNRSLFQYALKNHIIDWT